MKTLAALLVALIPLLACAEDGIRLAPGKDANLELPYGETKKIEFVCPWDATKKPTVFEFNGRIDTPTKDASTGGPVDLLRIELNGTLLDGLRLINKPMTSPRDPSVSSAVVWYTEPHWGLMYCGSWSAPTNQYTPRQGSPVHFVLDVSDLVLQNVTNGLVFSYAKHKVGDKTLAEHCRELRLGDAIVVLGDPRIRPRKTADVFQQAPLSK